jgi:GTP cyclohydrolase III
MSKQIVFKVNNEGHVTIDKLEGYGSGCLDATKMLERALGMVDESSRKMTHEYDKDLTVDNAEHIRH